MKDYSFSEINKIIKIQKIFKSHKKNINELNDKMNMTYNNIYSIMKRIHNNFLLGIITQYEYNSDLLKLDIQLSDFKKLPRPFKLRHLKDKNINNLFFTIRNIDKNLFDITKKTGSFKLFDAIYLYFGYTVKNILSELDSSEKNLIYFYNNVYIPLSIDIYDLENINIESNNNSLIPFNKNKISKKQYDLKNIPFCDKAKCFDMFKKNKSFLEKIQGARLYIPLRNCELGVNHIMVYEGYFLEDPLNISRVGGVLEDKNSNLLSKLEYLDINDYFKNAFVQQISLRDFLLYDNDTLVNKCLEAFEELKKLKKETISSLVKDFLSADLPKQRDILTLFLLMKDDVDTQYLAYLMYDMITNESYLLKPQPLAEQVFNSLHWSVQKLFKVAIKKINKNTNKLLNFNEEEISYEKRIYLMKTNDYVKSKAMEKYKEYSKSGEGSTKCLQYVEGILKIPFGIYRKERILCFLDEYRCTLNIFINNFIVECKKYTNKYFENGIQENMELCQEYCSNLNIKILDNDNTGSTLITNIKNDNEIMKPKKEKKLKSQEIDHFINKFNSNMYIEYDDSYEVENILKYCKGLKKKELVSVIKLINEDLEIKGQSNMKIDEKLKRTELRDKVSEFLVNPLNIDIAQKYINYLDKDRKTKIINSDDLFLSSVNTKFFDLNNKWFNYKNDYKNYLHQANTILDDAVYHQEEAKLQIKRVIAQWINGEMKGYCFGFEGPPGTGKTSLAKKGIAKCLRDECGNDRPFAFIALGGSSNGTTLEGHSYTYVGSTWGRIVDILMESKCMNPIIYIDELDKVSKTENGKEIIGILTHLTDSSQNDEFTDKYFSGIKFDLSKVLFIFSYNDYNLLDPILADRIHRVKFNKLNKYEKIHIINNYILPELLEIVGFNKEDIIFNKKVLEYLINTYTNEAGVRKIKEKVFEILREINLRYLMDKENKITIPLNVSIELIEEIFHSNPKITVKKIAPTPRVGLVNGLYATASGLGGITIIESFKTPSESKLSLELTGQQGDVMKESMKVAKTVAWNLIPNIIKKRIYKEMDDNGSFGIHLHCPEGATPKDGPSAGAAITLAIVSLLTGIKVSNKVALTGEIDLNGSIHEIGGLESKIEGGKNAGAKKILYPSKNQKDVDLIKEKGNIIDNTIEVIKIDNIWEVLELCLEKNEYKFNKYIE